MQALVAGLTAVDWGTHLTAGWARARSSSSSAYAWAAALPQECRLAMTHTAMVCAGHNPQYYSVPGFGPLSLAWGWLLIGVVVGVAMAIMFMGLGGCLRREPAIGALALMANANAPPGLANDRARQDVLNFIAAGGRPALQELAMATGMSEVDFLGAMLGTNQPRLNAAFVGRPHTRII